MLAQAGPPHPAVPATFSRGEKDVFFSSPVGRKCRAAAKALEKGESDLDPDRPWVPSRES